MSAVKRLALDLGRCPRCMRQCFIAATAGWAVTVSTWVFGGGSTITEFSGALALVLTSLWLLHITVFAARVVADPTQPASAHVATDHARRAFICAFSRAFGGVALATALPARRARADGAECPATSGSYCPDLAPYCCYSPSRDLYYCRVDISHCDL